MIFKEIQLVHLEIRSLVKRGPSEDEELNELLDTSPELDCAELRAFRWPDCVHAGLWPPGEPLLAVRARAAGCESGFEEM